MPTENGTAATATNDIDTAGDAIAALMDPTPKRKPATAATATEERDDDSGAEDETEEETEVPAEGDEAHETEEAEESEEGSEEESEGDSAAEARSALEALPKKELDREIYLPIGENGALEKTTLREALRGHLREADYTKKTMALAAERDNTRKAQQEHVARRDRYDQILAVLETQAKEVVETLGGRTQAEWDSLYERDAPRFYAEQAKLLEFQRKQENIAAEKQRVNSERQRENQERFIAHVTEQASKLRVMLEVKDQADETAKVGAIQRYLKEHPQHSFTDDEIKAIAPDARAYVIIDKARRYDELMKAKGTVKDKQVVKTPTAKPLATGTSKPAATSAQVKAKQAVALHKKSQSIDSAGDAIAALEAANAKRRR